MCRKLASKGISCPSDSIDYQPLACGGGNLTCYVFLVTKGTEVIDDRAAKPVVSLKSILFFGPSIVGRGTEDCITHSPMFVAVTIDEVFQSVSKICRKLGEKILVRELRQVSSTPVLLKRLADDHFLDPQHSQIFLGESVGVGHRR